MNPSPSARAHAHAPNLNLLQETSKKPNRSITGSPITSHFSVAKEGSEAAAWKPLHQLPEEVTSIYDW